MVYNEQYYGINFFGLVYKKNEGRTESDLFSRRRG
jgi:hypothetical protein